MFLIAIILCCIQLICLMLPITTSLPDQSSNPTGLSKHFAFLNVFTIPNEYKGQDAVFEDWISIQFMLNASSIRNGMSQYVQSNDSKHMEQHLKTELQKCALLVLDKVVDIRASDVLIYIQQHIRQTCRPIPASATISDLLNNADTWILDIGGSLNCFFNMKDIKYVIFFNAYFDIILCCSYTYLLNIYKLPTLIGLIWN